MSADDRKEVLRLINEWNSSRYELFAISQPNERLEFHGVMRFYFQDAGEKVSTKCVRVESTASTEDVINVLIEKFRPDMKLLPSSKDFAIYEIHSDSQERKLAADERPLWTQLEWGRDGREGRFLLKNEYAKTVQFDAQEHSLLRDKKRMSKRDKKRQQQRAKEAKEAKANVVENLYKEVPDSNFTRSISNPEIVMARRRQQKLENKLKQIKNRDGGGTLKVYGETLKPDIPYKTLLMSNQDTAAFAVKETLEKYGLATEDPDNYCLVQVVTPSREEREKYGAQIKEYILEDNACPLAILIKHPATGGSIIFQIRRCTPDILAVRKQKKKAEQEKQSKLQAIQQAQLNSNNAANGQQQQQQQQQQNLNLAQKNGLAQQKPTGTNLVNDSPSTAVAPTNTVPTGTGADTMNRLPCLVELSYEGFDVPSPRVIQLKSDFYELGNDKTLAAAQPTSYIRLDPSLPGIDAKHCALKKSHDNTQIVLIPFSESYVNDRRTMGPVQLSNGNTIRLGKFCVFRVENPNDQSAFSTPTFNGHQQAQIQQQQQQNNNMLAAKNVNNSGSQLNGNPMQQINQRQQMNPQQQQVIPPNYGVLYESGQVAADSDIYIGPIRSNSQTAQPQAIPQVSQQQVQQSIIRNNNTQQPSTPPVSKNHNPPHQINTTNTTQQQNGPATTTTTTAVKHAEPGLPGLLEFPEDGEDQLLATICSTSQSQWQFKLAPVYTMYMMLRFRLSQKYKSEVSFGEKLHSLSLLIHKMVNYIREAVDANHLERGVLPYWLANAAELLYFLKQDAHLAQVSFDAQDALADCVQITFKYLVNIMQQQLDAVLAAFFDPSDHVEDAENTDSINNEFVVSRPHLRHVINVLNETMSLLRGSRVNAALTIQLFSQLFHYVSMWLFNRLVVVSSSGNSQASLCSRYWGEKLMRRLGKVQSWAERQGLELAADCHLQRIIQSAFFLQAQKHDPAELSTISSNCFSLNSVQIRFLLRSYVVGAGEPAPNAQLCANLVSIAQNTADEVIRQEGRQVQLQEECDLQLPFLLPEDGHSCEIIKGLPAGLLDFLEQLQNAGLCWLWQNTQGPGSWKKFMIKDQQQLQQQQQPPLIQSQMINGHQQITTTPVLPSNNTAPVSNNGRSASPMLPRNQQLNVNMDIQQPLQQQNQIIHDDALDNGGEAVMTRPQPQVVKIKLMKKNNGLGLSIVAAKGLNQITGIYVKSVVAGGAAADDGRIDAGDQLLAVDEASLVNVTQERAAELMTRSGHATAVLLTVAKEAATYNGLDALLCKSPVPMQQQQQQQPTGAVSMPALNSQNMQYNHQQLQQQQQQLANNFTAATLPRNHNLHNNNNAVNNGPFLQHQTSEPNNSAASNEQFDLLRQQQQQQQQILMTSSQTSSSNFKARSMSQEVLNSNRPITSTVPPATGMQLTSRMMSPVANGVRVLPPPPSATAHMLTKPGPAVAPRPLSNLGHHQQQQQQQQTVLSPTHSYQRTLPNESQTRYGSERPVSMHQLQIQQQQQFNSNQQTTGRNLPNEIAPRFGSERPAMTAASTSNILQQNNMSNGIAGSYHTRRFNSVTDTAATTNALPRPQQPLQQQQSSSPLRQAQHQPILRHPPIQQQQQHQTIPFQLQQQQQLNQFDELDEINYNQLQIQQQQQQQQQQQINSGRGSSNINGQVFNHDELYGKANPNRGVNLNNNKPALSSMNGLQNGLQQQQLDEQQRTKSVGQLYEHIWNNQQNGAATNSTSQSAASVITATNGELHQNHNGMQHRPIHLNNQHHNHHNQPILAPKPTQAYSVDDLNMRQLEITNGMAVSSANANGMAVSSGNANIARISRPNIQQANNINNATTVNTTQHNLNQQHQMMMMRNYENQVVNSNKPTVPPPPPALLSKLNIPHKPMNVNVTAATSSRLFEQQQPMPQVQPLPSYDSTTSASASAVTLAKQWEREQWSRKQEEEEFRLNLLRQRMEMLRELEAKPQTTRTAEDETRLDKLRTEIEFDKRVLEMNSYPGETHVQQHSTVNYNVEDNINNGGYFNNQLENQQNQEFAAGDDNGAAEYMADQRERLVSQMRDEMIMQQQQQNSRYKFDQVLKHDAANFKSNLMAKMRSDEADRAVEAKREELRLRKHVEQLTTGASITNSGSNLNGSSSNSRSNLQNGVREEIEVMHVNGVTTSNHQSYSNLNSHLMNSQYEQQQFQQASQQNGMGLMRPQKHVQFMAEPSENAAVTVAGNPSSANSSPKSNSNKTPSSSSSSSDQLDSSPSTPPPPPPLQTQPPPPSSQQAAKRVMFSDTSKLLEFERSPNGAGSAGDDLLCNTPCVIGANEVYVDKRLKIKQQQQRDEQMEKAVVEGEKLSFKDKMKLFAKQSGENLSALEAEAKFKVSRKQREIESKFEVK